MCTYVVSKRFGVTSCVITSIVGWCGVRYTAQESYSCCLLEDSGKNVSWIAAFNGCVETRDAWQSSYSMCAYTRQLTEYSIVF